MEGASKEQRRTENIFVRKVWQAVDKKLSNNYESPLIEKVVAMEIEGNLNIRSIKIAELPNCTYGDFCRRDNGELLNSAQDLTIELLPHQREAVRWMLWAEKNRIKGGLLADEMGLGKSITTIALILKELELNKESSSVKKQTLIICPASLINQWIKEINDNIEPLSLIVCKYAEDNRPTTMGELKNFHLVVVSYDIVRLEWGSRSSSLLFNTEWYRIIVDEAHRLRDKENQVFQSVDMLKSKIRWGLTGSPVNNKPDDIYTLLKFIGYRNASAHDYRGSLKQCMLRRSFDFLLQNNLIHNVQSLEVIPEIRKLDGYHQMAYEAVAYFLQPLSPLFKKHKYFLKFCWPPASLEDALECVKIKMAAKTKETPRKAVTFSTFNKLVDFAVHPGLVYTEKNRKSLAVAEITLTNFFITALVKDCPENIRNVVGDIEYKTWKIERTIEIVQNILAQSEKVIIVSQWVAHLLIVEKFLKKEKIFCSELLTGFVDFQQRTLLNDKFNGSGHPQILLVSLHCSCEGLNLIGANNMIILDCWHNPQKITQMTKRIHRLTQKKKAIVHLLIAKDTREEDIYKKSLEKLNVASRIMNEGNQESLSQLRKIADEIRNENN